MFNTYGYGVDDNIRYYSNYRLDDITVYDLSDKDKQCLDVAIYFLDHRISLSKLAEEFCVSKSYAHNCVSKRVKYLSYELWELCHKQLKANIEKNKFK